MKIKLGLFQDEISIPDGYSKLDKKIVKQSGEKGDWLFKPTENSINCISFFEQSKKDAMNFDNKQELIDGIHSIMSDKQGLICVTNGTTNNGHKFIYSIIKTIEDPIIGACYFLRMNIQYDKKIYELEGEFTEQGTTGVRDAIISQMLMNENIITLEDGKLKGWFKDPYDDSYKKGILMNLSEEEKYDQLFPDHPLSQARELINYIINKQEPKKHSLDEQLNESIKLYNDSYNQFSDIALQLYFQRVRSVDTIQLVEKLINSIARHPKSFDSDFAEINKNKVEFLDAQDFADKELSKAKKEAGTAGAGVAAGAAVTALAPTAAMWVATTFGTASTGTAISALSGAAATNAALAWLGGGTLASGGLGIAGGHALLALAGPIGWGIAGFSILTSVVLFANNKIKSNKKKQEEITSVKTNIHHLEKDVAFLTDLLTKTETLRTKVNELYSSTLSMYERDYAQLNEDQKYQLGSLVNNTKALAATLALTLDKENE